MSFKVSIDVDANIIFRQATILIAALCKQTELNQKFNNRAGVDLLMQWWVVAPRLLKSLIAWA